MNPDLKIYNTTIELDNGGDMNLLRAGMNCTVEIIVDQYKETLYVPVQAVIRVGGQPTVYVVDGDELKPRNVELGLDNNSMIRIVSGLEVGERVSLAPPLTEGAVEAAKYDEGLEIPEAPEDTGTPTGMNMPGQSEGSPSAGSSGSGQQGRGFPAGDQQGSSQRSSGFPGGGQQGMRFPAGGQPFGNPMERLDKDKDGKVSKEEFPMPDRFSDMDKDGDGYITESEFSSAWQQRSGQQGGEFPGASRQGGSPPSGFPGGDQ
jgi:hypothetical protein